MIAYLLILCNLNIELEVLASQQRIPRMRANRGCAPAHCSRIEATKQNSRKKTTKQQNNDKKILLCYISCIVLMKTRHLPDVVAQNQVAMNTAV